LLEEIRKEANVLDIKEFAKMLDGREMGMEIKSTEENRARELGFVVVYGYSDDNAEFAGAISDEVGCFDGGTIYLDKDGIFENCECECKYSKRAKENCKVIEAKWCQDGYSWTYQTDIPHATFVIREEDEAYCRGIVFELKSLE
jgi:hypothetical protein